MAKSAQIHSVSTGKPEGTIELPIQFFEAVRTDVIKRSVFASQNNRRQGYGPDPESGQRSSASYKGTRKGWGHSYNYGQARIPRLLIKKGGRRAGQAKTVPQAVGGRSSHAPMPHKNYSEAINKKENRLAIRAAISATAKEELVFARGHKAEKGTVFPIIVDKGVETLAKTKDFEALFEKLGLGQDLERGRKIESRPGKGKMRGRPFKGRKSILLVVSGTVPKGARNIPGVDTAKVSGLNCEKLAPGGVPGRLTVWSAAAIEKMKEENLYV